MSFNAIEFHFTNSCRKLFHCYDFYAIHAEEDWALNRWTFFRIGQEENLPLEIFSSKFWGIRVPPPFYPWSFSDRRKKNYCPQNISEEGENRVRFHCGRARHFHKWNFFLYEGNSLRQGALLFLHSFRYRKVTPKSKPVLRNLVSLHSTKLQSTRSAIKNPFHAVKLVLRNNIIFRSRLMSVYVWVSLDGQRHRLNSHKSYSRRRWWV